MIVQKYLPDKKKYINYKIPDEWKISLYCENLDDKVNCVSCGKELSFGKTFTSRTFHNAFGIGYCECEKCYFSNFDNVDSASRKDKKRCLKVTL